MNIWKTRSEWTKEALEYNPRISENIDSDPDYIIRGKVFDPKTGLYAFYSLAIVPSKEELDL